MLNITSLVLFVIVLTIFCAVVICINTKQKAHHIVVTTSIFLIVFFWAILIACCEALFSPTSESKLGRYTSIVDDKYVVTTKMARINDWYLINNGDMLFYSEDDGHNNRMTIRYMDKSDVEIMPVPDTEEQDFHVEMYHARKKFLCVYTEITYYKIFICPEYISTDTDFLNTWSDRE